MTFVVAFSVLGLVFLVVAILGWRNPESDYYLIVAGIFATAIWLINLLSAVEASA